MSARPDQGAGNEAPGGGDTRSAGDRRSARVGRDAPDITPGQILSALARRRERRREVAAEVAAALAALSTAVERHAAKVLEVRRAVEAQGGDLEPLQFYDSLMASFRMELRAAERTLADVFRVAADEAAAAR